MQDKVKVSWSLPGTKAGAGEVTLMLQVRKSLDQSAMRVKP